MNSIAILSLFFTYILGLVSGDVVSPHLTVSHHGKSGKFTYTVGIICEHGVLLCPGAIIGRNWVLTSATCPKYFQQIVKYVIPPEKLSSHRIYEISLIVYHEEYISSDLSNDIALVKVSKKFRYNKFVSNIPVNPTFIAEDVKATLIGFEKDIVSLIAKIC